MHTSNYYIVCTCTKIYPSTTMYYYLSVLLTFLVTVSTRVFSVIAFLSYIRYHTTGQGGVRCEC